MHMLKYSLTQEFLGQRLGLGLGLGFGRFRVGLRAQGRVKGFGFRIRAKVRVRVQGRARVNLSERLPFRGHRLHLASALRNVRVKG